jgi:hypothetical protein
MKRFRNGQFAPRPLSESAPLFTASADELSRAAKLLSDHAKAVKAAKRAAWWPAHCAAIRGTM